MITIPRKFSKQISVFAPLFSKKVSEHVKILFLGGLLTVGRRTVGSPFNLHVRPNHAFEAFPALYHVAVRSQYCSVLCPDASGSAIRGARFSIPGRIPVAQFGSGSGRAVDRRVRCEGPAQRGVLRRRGRRALEDHG